MKPLLLSFITLSFFLSCDRFIGIENIPSYRTIIAYVAVDNDLSEDAFENIRDMELGFEEKGVNLIVFIDPDNDSPHILRIKKGGSTRIKTYQEFNSAEPGNMKKVLNDIISQYPAEQYGLILLSHGSSWMPAGSQLRSFSWDNGIQMDINDLADALPVRFDFILMDVCLMSSVEVVYELKDKADYIIASASNIVYTGFPYKMVIPELIQPVPNLKDVAENFFNYYDRLSGDYRTATISLINTGEMDSMAIITNQLLIDNVFDITKFDRKSVQRLDLYDEQYAFDFLDFFEKAFPDVNKHKLKEQLNKVVLFQAHTPRIIDEFDIHVFCGLSCYIPLSQRSDINTFYRHLKWCQDSGFYRFFQ